MFPLPSGRGVKKQRKSFPRRELTLLNIEYDFGLFNIDVNVLAKNDWFPLTTRRQCCNLPHWPSVQSTGGAERHTVMSPPTILFLSKNSRIPRPTLLTQAEVEMCSTVQHMLVDRLTRLPYLCLFYPPISCVCPFYCLLTLAITNMLDHVFVPYSNLLLSLFCWWLI